MGFYRAIMSLECLSGVFVFVASNDTHKKANEQTKENVVFQSYGNFETSSIKFIAWSEIK